nr:reverse transcriptase domain-containing protein [Tanacetum cinerariifolium]
MHTRSSSNLIVESFTIPKRRNRRRSKQIVEPELQSIVETPVVTMANTHALSELLQAPTEGYGDAVVIPAILAENFELKTAWTWLEKEPPRSIHTWEDLVSKFVNYLFSPSKITNLKNEITNFQQRFDDSLNAAIGGNLLNRTPRDALTIIENKSKVRTLRNKPVVSKVNNTTSSSSPSLDITALTDIVKELVLMNKANKQASVKAVEEICVTCGVRIRTMSVLLPVATLLTPVQPRGPIIKETNDVNIRAMQNQISNIKTELKNKFKTTMLNQKNELRNTMSNEIKNMMSSFIQMQSPSGSGSLPSNIVANPRGDLKAITTRSGVSYDGPTISPTPSPLPKEVECETEATKEKKLSLQELTPTCMTLELADRSVAYPVGVAEDVFVKVGKFYFLADFVVVDYDVDPRVPLILGRPFLKTTRALIDVHDEELTLRVNDEAITSTSGNPTPSDPIIASSSPSFTPFEGSDFILEEIETFLRTSDELSTLVDDFDPEGDIALIEKMINEDPSLNLPPMNNEDLKQVDVTMTKPSIKEPLKLELKDLPFHLEYPFLEGTDKLPIIIFKELKDEEKTVL